jgi:hypothetical protein
MITSDAVLQLDVPSHAPLGPTQLSKLLSQLSSWCPKVCSQQLDHLCCPAAALRLCCDCWVQGTAEVQLEYRPGSLGLQENGCVMVASDTAGSIEYNCSGKVGESRHTSSSALCVASPPILRDVLFCSPAVCLGVMPVLACGRLPSTASCEHMCPLRLWPTSRFHYAG